MRAILPAQLSSEKFLGLFYWLSRSSFLFQIQEYNYLMPGKITIYTDGAARGNPGPGGYGVVLLSGPHRKELSEGFRLTTNNRMELLAVINGLEEIGRAHV